MKTIVFMFVRWPEIGQVKTRLIPALGEEGATDLYRVMLLEQFAQLREGKSETIQPLLYVTPVEKLGKTLFWLNGMESPIVDGLPQPDGPLGERLAHAMRWGFEKLGADRVIFVGSDCPDIAATHVLAANEALAGQEAVIGRAADGGYYLLGLAKSFPGVLETVSYSESDTAEQTIAALEAAGAKVDRESLPVLSDVDTAEDLARLSAETINRLRDRALQHGVYVEWLEKR